MNPPVITETHIEEFPLLGRGKVRDLYDVGEHLLIVTTDRISAFDVVLPQGIPGKGRILTRLSVFWFERFGSRFPCHVVTADLDAMPGALAPHAAMLEGRCLLVEKLSILPIECVVRGYLAGSGWKDYQETGAVSGVSLPAGLTQADRLEEPIFTPATKAERGEHDENISYERMAETVGAERAAELRDRSVALYSAAREYAESRGIILADTKFEWGVRPGGGPAVLADEVLTPDSSRFWPQEHYRPGISPPSFDKQYVRDYLLTLDWDHRPPAPDLPPHVVEETAAKYREIYQRLTGDVWVG